MLRNILLITFFLLFNSCQNNSKTQLYKTSHQINKNNISIIEGFAGPYGITIHKDKIYVPDLKAGVVYKFNKQFEYEQWLGFSITHKNYGWFKEFEQRSIDNPEPLKGPHALAIDREGNILIADYYSRQVRVFNSKGEFVFNLNDNLINTDAALIGPANVYIDSKENIWISDWLGHKVVKLNSKFEFLGYLADTGEENNGFVRNGKARASQNLGGLNKPHMVAVDVNDNVYIVESENNRVQKFDSTGHSLGWIGAIANRNKTTDRFQLDHFSEASSIPGGFRGPCSISIANNNYLIVSDNPNNRIQFFNLEGVFKGWIGASSVDTYTALTKSSEHSISSNLPGAFSAPFHAVLEQEKLYVADGHNRRIQIISMELP